MKRDYDYELFPRFTYGMRGAEGGMYAIEEPVSTDELIAEYHRHVKELNELREQEPAKKRGRKDEYRSWVWETHWHLKRLREIEEELQARNKESR